MTVFKRAMLTGLLLTASLATSVAAQDTNSQATITVEAPRTVPVPVGRSATTGAQIITTTVKMSVRYDDLDLSQPADGERLMTRVGRVAQDACEELDRLYPLSPDADCRARAAANGREAAKAVIVTAMAAR